MTNTDAGRVMVITPWDRMWSLSGGGAPSWAYLVEGLMDAGFTLDIIAPPSRTSDYPEHPRLRIVPTEPLRPQRGPLARERFWLERTARLARGATRHAREHGVPDVVYGFSEMATPAASLCAKRWHRPSVGKLFGTFLGPAVGHPIELLRHWDEALGFRVPLDRLVVHDDGTRGDEVARWLRVPEGRVRFWRNGVDREACSLARSSADAAALLQELGLPADTRLIYAASRLVSWKRVDRIVRAMVDVRGAHPTAHLVIAGDGESRGELEQLAANLGIGHAITFAGAVPRQQNLQLMAAADVFPSTYDYSNLGNALHEAMSCAAAVVVTDTGRTTELVRDGVSGLVVPPDDTPALAGALNRILADDPLRERLKQGALADSLSVLPSKEERIGWEIDMVRSLVEER